MLPSLVAAFLSGLLAGSFFPYVPFSLCVLLLIAAAVFAGLEAAGRITGRQGSIWYGGLLLGLLYWSLMVPWPANPHEPASRRDLPLLEVTGRIVSPVQHAPARETLLLRADSSPARLDGGGLIRVVWREPDVTLLQGDRVRFRAKVHEPSGSLNPGGFDYGAYLERQGIDAVATVTGPAAVTLIESGSASWRWTGWNRIDRWRAVIRDAAVRTLAQPAVGLFLGIVIGERGYLQPEVQEWFMATGTVHLLSISGSHLGLVAVVCFWVVRRAVLWLPAGTLLTLSRAMTPSRVAIVVTWPAVAAYALLAGAELATIRSLVMITLALGALWLGYERRLHHAMAAAAALIVLHDPRAVYDISFQLSFLSVFLIIHCVSWLQAREPSPDGARAGALQALGRMGRDAFVMSTAVTVGTLPVVLLYFNQVPWVGLAANLVAIPVTGVLLVPLGLLSAAWTIATGSADLAAGWQAALLVWLIDGLRWIAGFPGVEWHAAAPWIPSVVLFYAALLAAGRDGGSRVLRVTAAVLAALCVGWWLWSPRLGVDGDRWRVTFLDVGQGDSAVIELPNGHTVLIDGGARYERFDVGRSIVAPFLWNRGIRRIDHVIGTHQQLDHVGGLIWVVRHVPVAHYWGTGMERPEQFVADLQGALKDRGLLEQPLRQGDEVLPDGPCRLTIVHPGAHPVVRTSGRSSGGTALNNQSIASRLRCGPHSIVFAADLEVDALRGLTGVGREPATVLKVPHHGAASSLDREWIKALHPHYAVVSVGQANPYGHPVPAVLQAYAEEHVRLYRTDRDGAVWITGRLSRADLRLTTMRELLLQPVSLPLDGVSGDARNWHRVRLQLRERDLLLF